MVEHTVSVVISFPLSSVKAAEVLERWWAAKARGKAYMREYRKKKPKEEGKVL